MKRRRTKKRRCILDFRSTNRPLWKGWTHPVGVAVVAAVLVLNLLRPEYPDEAHEGPGQRRQQVEDDAELGHVLDGWNIQRINHLCRAWPDVDWLTCIDVLRLTEPVVEEVNDWREEDQSSWHCQPHWDVHQVWALLGTNIDQIKWKWLVAASLPYLDKINVNLNVSLSVTGDCEVDWVVVGDGGTTAALERVASHRQHGETQGHRDHQAQ